MWHTKRMRRSLLKVEGKGSLERSEYRGDVWTSDKEKGKARSGRHRCESPRPLRYIKISQFVSSLAFFEGQQTLTNVQCLPMVLIYFVKFNFKQNKKKYGK